MRHGHRLRDLSDHELLVEVAELLLSTLITNDHDLQAENSYRASRLLAEHRRRKRRGRLQCTCSDCMRFSAG